jgi:hypothetical protein
MELLKESSQVLERGRLIERVAACEHLRLYFVEQIVEIASEVVFGYPLLDSLDVIGQLSGLLFEPLSLPRKPLHLDMPNCVD